MAGYSAAKVSIWEIGSDKVEIKMVHYFKSIFKKTYKSDDQVYYSFLDSQWLFISEIVGPEGN